LNLYGRTKKLERNYPYEPLIFSNDKENSYTSYTDCLRTWVKRSFTDKEKNVIESMKKAAGKYENKALESLNHGHKDSLDYEVDMSVYNDFERSFKCSGMCRPALFFFDLKITEHPPPDHTCFEPVKNFILLNAKKYSKLITVVGVINIITFALSFALCECKKKRDHRDGFK